MNDIAARYEERFGQPLYTPEISFTVYRDGVTERDFFQAAEKCIADGKPMNDKQRAKFFEPFADGVLY